MEEILGKSARHQDPHQIWTDIRKNQIWTDIPEEQLLGVVMVGRNGTVEVRCDPMGSGTHNSKPLSRRHSNLSSPYHVPSGAGTGSQKYAAKIPSTPRLPRTARTTIEQYLKLAGWASLLTNKDSQEGGKTDTEPHP